MPVDVVNNRGEQRYEAIVDGEVAGFATYHTHSGVVALMHTEVESGLQGHGIGSTLIREALEDARRQGLGVLPFCPFVGSFIAQHREFSELVPESRRAEFHV